MSDYRIGVVPGLAMVHALYRRRLARCAIAGAICLITSSVSAISNERPNFLLIVADDLCWRDLGFTGNDEVHTPHLDRLAEQGMQLNGMFAPATTCSPCRHSLLTGLYCVRAGAYPNHTRLYDGTQSVFTHFNQLGYRTALQGKQHVGPKSSFPYEHLAGVGKDTFADQSREFMTRDEQNPWLLVFASHDPHSPWTRGPQEQYGPNALSIPPYLHDNATTRRLLASHYAEITKLDEQVGALMTLLDETGQADNTLVMFVSEQGNSLPGGGKWSVYDNGIKVACVMRWPNRIESGSESAALVQYPDVVPTFLDAAGVDPTTIDTGCPDAEGNRGFDGRSFLKVLVGDSTEHRPYVFAQHTTVGINGFREPYPMRAVRDQRYKLIRNLAPDNTYWIRGIHEGQPITSWQADAENDPELLKRLQWLSHRPAEELYDLAADPYETNNLAGEPRLTEIKISLGKELDRWMRQQGDQGMTTELAAHSRQNRNRQEAGRKK